LEELRNRRHELKHSVINCGRDVLAIELIQKRVLKINQRINNLINKENDYLRGVDGEIDYLNDELNLLRNNSNLSSDCGKEGNDGIVNQDSFKLVDDSGTISEVDELSQLIKQDSNDEIRDKDREIDANKYMSPKEKSPGKRISTLYFKSHKKRNIGNIANIYKKGSSKSNGKVQQNKDFNQLDELHQPSQPDQPYNTQIKTAQGNAYYDVDRCNQINKNKPTRAFTFENDTQSIRIRKEAEEFREEIQNFTKKNDLLEKLKRDILLSNQRSKTENNNDTKPISTLPDYEFSRFKHKVLFTPSTKQGGDRLQNKHYKLKGFRSNKTYKLIDGKINNSSQSTTRLLTARTVGNYNNNLSSNNENITQSDNDVNKSNCLITSSRIVNLNNDNQVNNIHNILQSNNDNNKNTNIKSRNIIETVQKLSSKSNKSNKSNKLNKSIKSNKSNNSHKSHKSHKSNKSNNNPNKTNNPNDELWISKIKKYYIIHKYIN